MAGVHTTKELLERIRTIEHELGLALEEKEHEFRYRWSQGKARFEQEAIEQHRKLKTRLPRYIAESRLLAILSAPVIYAGMIPFVVLDVFLFVYQGVCFPIYGIPKVRRADYVIFDRGHLKYLNLVERLNCAYCSYANGLLAYAVEVTARTEQHWCPIKHARRLRAPHSRYQRFFDYGDAQRYREQIEGLRKDFEDLVTDEANRTEKK
ncbi:MAG: hypothetical protein IT165_04405 [Bryobacterales bacterium]|nr:hypothetical protein [Bryobacterales bacterium]